MIPRRTLLTLAAFVVSAAVNHLHAQEANEKAPAPNEVYRVFHMPDFDWYQVLEEPEPSNDPFGSSLYGPFDYPEPKQVAAGKLAPLLEQNQANDLSKNFRKAGIHIGDGGALQPINSPLLFVRAAPEEIEKIEKFREPGAQVGTDENLWCRAVVVAGAVESEANDVEGILDEGTVLSDLILFTTGTSKIRLGSLAGETESESSEEWGASIELKVPDRDHRDEGIAVAVSLRSPPGSGQPEFRLDWEGTAPLSSIGKTVTFPVTFEGGAGLGHLILRFESVPPYAWDEPIADLIRRKEALWRELGPGFEPEFLPEESEWDDVAWVRKNHVIDPATDSAYYETFAPPGFMSAIPGSAKVSPSIVSTAGFRDVFSAGKVYDVRYVLEAYGLTFRPGDVAVYNPLQFKLFARVASDQVLLMGAVFAGGGYHYEKSIRLRAATLASVVNRSADLARPLFSEMKDARIADSRTLIARSGQRAWIESDHDTFELDPVLGPDDRTLDVILSLNRRGGDLDYAVVIEGFIQRDQIAMVQLGAVPGSPERVHRIAIRAELLTQTGIPLPDFLAPTENGDGIPGKVPTTLWEKRGPKFKLVPIGPAPAPPFSPGPFGPAAGAAPDPFAAP